MNTDLSVINRTNDPTFTLLYTRACLFGRHLSKEMTLEVIVMALPRSQDIYFLLDHYFTL